MQQAWPLCLWWLSTSAMLPVVYAGETGDTYAGQYKYNEYAEQWSAQEVQKDADRLKNINCLFRVSDDFADIANMALTKMVSENWIVGRNIPPPCASARCQTFSTSGEPCDADIETHVVFRFWPFKQSQSTDAWHKFKLTEEIRKSRGRASYCGLCYSDDITCFDLSSPQLWYTRWLLWNFNHLKQYDPSCGTPEYVTQVLFPDYKLTRQNVLSRVYPDSSGLESEMLGISSDCFRNRFQSTLPFCQAVNKCHKVSDVMEDIFGDISEPDARTLLGLLHFVKSMDRYSLSGHRLAIFFDGSEDGVVPTVELFADEACKSAQSSRPLQLSDEAVILNGGRIAPDPACTDNPSCQYNDGDRMNSAGVLPEGDKGVDWTYEFMLLDQYYFDVFSSEKSAFEEAIDKDVLANNRNAVNERWIKYWQTASAHKKMPQIMRVPQKRFDYSDIICENCLGLCDTQFCNRAERIKTYQEYVANMNAVYQRIEDVLNNPVTSGTNIVKDWGKLLLKRALNLSTSEIKSFMITWLDDERRCSCDHMMENDKVEDRKRALWTCKECDPEIHVFDTEISECGVPHQTCVFCPISEQPCNGECITCGQGELVNETCHCISCTPQGGFYHVMRSFGTYVKPVCRELPTMRIEWSSDASEFRLVDRDAYVPDSRDPSTITYVAANSYLDLKTRQPEYCSNLNNKLPRYYFRYLCGSPDRGVAVRVYYPDFKLPQYEKYWNYKLVYESSTARIADVIPAEFSLQPLSSPTIKFNSAYVFEIVREGHTVRCLDCVDGQYNSGCNGVDGGSFGECLPCLNSAPEGHFLWHPQGGCEPRHEPVSNYLVEPCQKVTSVNEKRFLLVVGCGASINLLQTLDRWHESEVERVYSPDGTTVIDMYPTRITCAYDDTPACRLANVLLERASIYSNYSTTMPYCPPGWHLRNDQVTKVEWSNRFCKKCSTCAETLGKRKRADWQECSGEGLEDTQDRCMEGCDVNYFFNLDTEQCELCTTC